MKVNEIVREERLDEVAPIIIGGIALTQIITAVSAFFTAMTLIDLYKFIDNYGEDPESITDDQWFDVFLDVTLLAIPSLSKFGKPYIAKLIPASWKKYAGDYTRGIVLKRYRAERTAANAKFGKAKQASAPNARTRRDLKAKHAAATQAAKARAAKAMQQVSGDAIYKIALKAAGAGALASLADTYWTKISQVEEDWAAYKNGDRETETFGNMDETAAESHAYELKKKLWGELALGVGTMVATMSVGKKIEMFGNFFGRIAGGGLVGGIFKVPAEIGAAIVRVGGPGIAMFMQTDTGRKLLENPIIESISKIAGSAAVNTWETLKKLADQTAKALGIDLGIATQPNIKRPDFKDPDPWGIAITADPRNPKLQYIGGSPVTDPNTGYLLPTISNQIQNIRRKARAAGQPDPVEKIPRDPAAQYSELPV